MKVTGKKSYCVASSYCPSFSSCLFLFFRFLMSRSFLHISLALRKWLRRWCDSRCIWSNTSKTHSRSAQWMSQSCSESVSSQPLAHRTS